MSENSRELTFGEQLVGLQFNPGQNPEVAQVKTMFAEIADILEKEYRRRNLGAYPFTARLYDHAIGEVLNAQMNVVKVLTLKSE